ncbi:MAG: hypothetical protein L3J51_03670 [Cocleimonas sp.]|nr:hypothetical protein [Cocleimonas sp.]
MKLKTFTLMFSLLLGSVSFAETLPKGAIKDGSLSNQKLIGDAKVGVAAHVATLGCNKPEKVNFFVTQMPKGKAGSRVWKELWIVEGCKKKYPVKIRFQEDATGAVWTVGK